MEIADYRSLIESALVYAGGTHSYEDVVEAVGKGEMQFWHGPRSCIVTEIVPYPSRKVMFVLFAAGVQAELRAMTPPIERWARGEGCTLARLIGRRGWERSYLKDAGWHNAGDIVLEKELNGQGGR